MVNKKGWDEFRETGLVLYINQILHVFGWALVFDIDENNKVISCYPGRVKFRGFGSESITKSYIKISEYMKNNSDELLDEAKS